MLLSTAGEGDVDEGYKYKNKQFNNIADNAAFIALILVFQNDINI